LSAVIILRKAYVDGRVGAKILEVTSMDGRKHQSGGDMLDLSLLIQSIQRIEGNPDCFGSAAAGYCDRLDCQWRAYCLKEPENQSGTENGGLYRECKI
jgi:hypothetical protein